MLNNTFFDLTPLWDLIVAAVVLALGVIVVKAAIHGAKKGEPAHLGKYVGVAVLVCALLYIAQNATQISDSDTFHQVQHMAKLSPSGQTTTTR